jgi:hypothetical protein
MQCENAPRVKVLLLEMAQIKRDNDRGTTAYGGGQHVPVFVSFAI